LRKVTVDAPFEKFHLLRHLLPPSIISCLAPSL
jgi:hypothetical protein